MPNMISKILNSFIKYSPFVRNHVPRLCGNIDKGMLVQLLCVVEHCFIGNRSKTYIKISRANQVFSGSDSVWALKLFLELTVPLLVNFWMLGCVIHPIDVSRNQSIITSVVWDAPGNRILKFEKVNRNMDYCSFHILLGLRRWVLNKVFVNNDHIGIKSTWLYFVCT